MPQNDFIATIGLEVHAQLRTDSKIFSGDPTTFGAAPNSNVNPISLGHPGTLPRLNEKAVELAIRMGIACHSEITHINQFARKNYFYADLPKGYQISQQDTPICVGGYVTIKDRHKQDKKIRLVRIHLEEDSGKSLHDMDPYNSLIDLNRAGVGLIEIVTEPDITDEIEAYNYLAEIRKMVRYLDICDGNMEEGSLRCDANISVRPKGTDKLGQRTEVKNMNSLKNVQKAISFEIDRQVKVIEGGEKVVMETRSFDAVKGTTFAMRSKEEAHDYRYFPEPDLQAAIVSEDFIQTIRSAMPSLPAERSHRYISEYGLSEYDAAVLTEHRDSSDYFEAIVAINKNYKTAANWVMGPVRSYLNEHAVDLVDFPLKPGQIAALISLIDEGVLSHSVAVQQLFPLMIAQPDAEPKSLAVANDLIQQKDDDAILGHVQELLKGHPAEVERYRSGDKKLIGFFMGQLMRMTKGKVEPKTANAVLINELEN